jgi:xanthine dehydrogenase YagT iron-sulfur-binding subunit
MARRGHDDAPRRGFSRRGLLKGAGAVTAGGALLGGFGALAGADDEVRAQGPEAVAVALRVNGAEKTLHVEPRVTLLDALRGSPLGLTGPKPACDRGQCGACTVLLDGDTVYACTVLAVEAEGREVVTVEGLGTPEALHPVQQAFVEEDALQCGFCTPGMVTSCAWAVAKHGTALTEAQARAATAGNLCRCGTYPHVLKAALRAAKGR